jgi:hypothetical protein
MISMMRSGRSCLARGGEKRGRSVARGAATPQTRRCTHDRLRGSAKERDQEGEHRTNTHSLSARMSVGGELGPTSRELSDVAGHRTPVSVSERCVPASARTSAPAIALAMCREDVQVQSKCF